MATTVDEKLNMSLDDIVMESAQQQQPLPTNGVSGKTRNNKRSERIGQAGPYPQRGARTDDQSGLDTSAASAGRRVYVGNLSWSVQSQDLTAHMAAAGTVLHARVLGSSGRSKGCGVVEFATEDDAQRAIEMLHDTELDGRKIFVREDREAKPVVAAVPAARHESRGPSTDAVTTKRVYVGNLSWTVKWQSLKDHMKVAGTVIHADVLEEPNGRSKGCGLVEYETTEEAARAIATLNDTELEGRKIFVREDREPDGGSISSIAHRGTGGPRKAAPQSFGGGDDSSIYIGNLPWDVTWQVLKDRFRSVGDVDRAEIAAFPDGRSRGFGIVRFVHAEDARRAIEQFNGSEMNGRAIEVRLDKGRGKSQPTP